MANKRINDLPAETDPASDDVVLVDGATTRKATRANLLKENLEAIRALTSAADKGIQFTGAGTAATYDLTAAGKALLDDADAAAQRTTLGLGNVDNTSDATKDAATATLTNKTIDTAGPNTIKINGNTLAASAGTATVTIPNATDTLVGRDTTDTLTNKTLTSPVINSPTGIVKGDVGLGNVDNTSDATKDAATSTLTNKTISGASNTLSNIGNSSLTNSSMTIAGHLVSLGGSQAIAAADLSDGTTGTGAIVLAASPALTGTPTAPTASPSDNSTKIATTAYVDAQVSAGVSGVSSLGGQTGALTFDGGAMASTVMEVVRYDAAQSLTTAQQQQANANTGLQKYIGFYNGQDGSLPYNLGLAVGRSPKAFGRKGGLALISTYATTYKDSSGKQTPCPVLVGDRIYVYYEGYDGTRKSIFLEIYSTEGGLIEKPLEPVLLYSNVSGASSVSRPAVLYEPSDASAPFKMMFSRATSGTNATTIYAATSLDGVNWTVLGQALAVSSGWESTYLETSGRFLKDGSTYRLFYSGYNGTSWQSGELYNTGTFGTTGWTKNASNPLLSSRGGYDVALTADTTAGTKTVKVANSALFDVGAPIAVYSSGSFQLNRIAAIPDGTTLTTLYTWQGTYTTVSSSKVSQIHGRSVELCEVWYEDSTWKAIITCFQFINGQLAETTGYAETSSLSTPFTISPAEWPLALNSKIKDFDQVSAENLKFIRVQ